MKKQLLGFALYTCWLWTLFLEGPLLEQAAPFWFQTAESLFLTFLFCHSLSSFSCGYLLKHTRLSFNRLLLAAAVLTALLSGAFLSLPPLGARAAWKPVLALILAGAAGLSAAPLAISWCAALGLFTLSDSAVIFALGLSLSTGLTLLVAGLPFPVQVFLTTALPLGSGLMFLHQPHPPKEQPGNLDAPLRHFFPWQFYLLMALIYIAGGSMFKLLFVNEGFPQLMYWSNLSYAGMCLGGMFLLRRSRFPDLFILYRPVLPMVGLGFLALPLFQPQPLLSFLLLQGGLAAYDMYTWLLIASLSRAHLRPYTVCGYGLSWITFFIFSGDILHNLISSSREALPQTSYISALAGSICLIATQLYPRFPKNEAPPAAPPSPFGREPLTPPVPKDRNLSDQPLPAVLPVPTGQVPSAVPPAAPSAVPPAAPSALPPAAPSTLPPAAPSALPPAAPSALPPAVPSAVPPAAPSTVPPAAPSALPPAAPSAVPPAAPSAADPTAAPLKEPGPSPEALASAGTGKKGPLPHSAAENYQIDDLHVLLTPRERQVLLLLTQGRNYKSIAEKLGITTNTVKFHVGHIYDKFGLYNRQELLELLEKNLRPR